MKRLCLPGLAHRLGAPVLFVGALGLAAIAGCAGETPTGAGGGASTSTGEGGMATATSTATSASGTGGDMGSTTAASTSSVGGAGGAGGATASASSSASTGGEGGTGGGGFMPPVGTAEYPAESEQNNLKSSANVLQMGTKGFTASLYPLGDVDVFEADVTLGGSQLRAEISDGMGGCPVGVTTYMRVFDKSGVLLAGDKNSGAGNCSLLTPAGNPELQGLPVGQYFVQVENLSITPVPFYVVDIKLTPPSCGDGIVQFPAGEQCDDSGNVGGDGCSPTCQLEGLFGNEVEPNDTSATANPIGANDGMVAAIGASGDQDYFSFDVTVPGSSVALTIDDGLGKCPPGFDSKLYLYDSSGSNEIANDDESGDASCSAILPSAYPAVASLAVGTYYVKVEEYGNNDTTPFYVLGIKLQPPACGDGILQLGEQCDDGNLAAGDGCSPTCGLEGNFLTETEPNDTQATANPLGGADGFSAAISPIGDQDYFSFDVTTAGSSVFIQVTDGLNGCPNGFDSKLTLFSPVGALIATADDGGAAKCSLMSPPNTPATTNMAVGTYKVRVEYNGNSTQIPSYVVKIKVVAPGCGDSVLQPGEQCDDGNTTAGDGCDPTCHAEPPYEIEPNGTIATATPQWPGFNKWYATILPPDRDFFSFTLAAPGTAILTTHAVNDAATCPGDTLIHLDDSAGNELTFNDDGGVFPCSSLSKMLPAGTFYVWVQGYQDSKNIGPYQLDLTIN